MTAGVEVVGAAQFHCAASVRTAGHCVAFTEFRGPLGSDLHRGPISRDPSSAFCRQIRAAFARRLQR